MKLAVASDNFINVCGHIGRCNGFLIYKIENNKIVNVEKLENNFTHHKMSGANHNHSHGHSHSSLIEALSECSHLICTSAGWRLRDEFEQNNKQLVFTNESDAETAVNNFISGTLEVNDSGVCHSH